MRTLHEMQSNGFDAGKCLRTVFCRKPNGHQMTLKFGDLGEETE